MKANARSSQTEIYYLRKEEKVVESQPEILAM
jgi:hypothetical protein